MDGACEDGVSESDAAIIADDVSEQSKVISVPMVGGLHHRYTRRAA